MTLPRRIVGRNPAKRQKYGAQPVEIDGRRFASKKEAKRYGELKLLERAGEITGLVLQPSYRLQGPMGPLKSETGRTLSYRADFVYIDTKTNKQVIEDVKGMKTKVYLLKKAIMRGMGYEIKEI